MRTIRLFAILDELRTKKHPVAAHHLAQKFDVSERTIYRDMEMLQSMGAPIRGESGLGYQIESGYFLPPLHFDGDELDALLLGMQLVGARADKKLADAAMRAAAKVNSVLLESQRQQAETQPFRAFSNTDNKQDDYDAHLALLRECVRLRFKIEMDYLDLKDTLTHRLVRPLGLAVFDNVWLLAAWCETRKDFRSFRVDRIQIATKTPTKFHRESGKEFSDFVKRV